MAYMFDDYPAQQIIVSILVCIAAITGIFGNILVLVAVGFSKVLRNATNAFVTSLASCDLLTCLTIPYHMATILGDPPKNLGACKFFAGVFISTQIVSLITLSLIAVLRVCTVQAVSRLAPINSCLVRVCSCIGEHTFNRIYTKRNVGVMIAFSWIVPFLAVFVSSTTGWATLGYNEKYNICMIEASDSGIASVVAGIVVVIPSSVIIFTCYALIFSHMRKYYAESKVKPAPSITGAKPTDNNDPDQHISTVSNDRPNSTGINTENSHSSQRSKRENRYNCILFLVVCTFFVSFLPFSIAIICPNINAAVPWCAVLLISNSAINPIIYGLRDPSFHEVFKNIFTCNCLSVIREMISI